MGNHELKRPIEDQLSDPDPEPETEQRTRGQLLTSLIVGQTIAVAFLTIMTATAGLLIPNSGLLALLPLGAIAATVGLASYWLLQRNQFRLGSYLFLIGTSVAVTANVFIRGYQDASAIYYLWPILGAVAVLETRGGVLVAIISAIFYLALVAVQRLGYQTPPLPYDPQREVLLTVGSRVIMFFLLAFLAWLSGQRLSRALQKARQAARRWQELNQTLEQRVADRTRDLERRSVQLQAAAEVARDATTARELDDLLNRAVNLIRDRFAFYHAGIFLLDEDREYAVLRAATGEAGRQMLEQGHRLKVGEVGIVGYVTGSGRPRIALDVGADAVHFENPLLPETHSEMALPLQVGRQIIGALDVQSREPAAFDEDDVALLQTMADQLAVTIENARLLNQMQQTVHELEAATRHYTQESWRKAVQMSRPYAYRYRQSGVERIVEGLLEAGPAWKQDGSMVTATQPRVGGDGQENINTITVPIKLRDQKIGAFNLRPESDRIPTDAISLVEGVADRLALALENARLLEETEQRATHLAAAAEVARDATAILDVDQLLNETVHLISQQFGFYHAGVFLLDEQDGYAVLRAASSEGGKRMLKRGHRLKVGKVGIVGHAAGTGEPRIALDVGKDAAHFAHSDLPDTRSEMALPLKVRDRVIGVLDVQSTREAAFSEDDVAVLQTLADQLAAAIANARLFQEVRSDAMRRDLINKVQQAAAASLDPDEMLHQAGEVISQRLQRPSAIFVWEPEEQALRPVAVHDARGNDVPLANGLRVTREMNPTLFSKVVEGHSIAALNTLAPYPGHPATTLAEQMGLRSGIYVPLTARDQMLGVLALAQPERRLPEELDFVEIVGANLSVALENAWLYQEAVKTTEKLQEMDRLKSQFLANMSHELRTPLNSIIGFSRVILKGIDGPLTDMQRTDLQAVYDSGQHLLGLINDILDISKIQAGKMELSFEEMDLREIIKGVMSTAIALVKDKPVELRQSVPPDLPRIRVDSRRVRQVLLNLVGNAAKFTEEGFISIGAERRPTELVISVSDSGVGIPPNKLDTIFEEFTQVDGSSTRRAGGTGLGLSITRHFVELHGGRIWVESTPNVGTSFYIALPIEGPPEPVEEEEKEEAETEQLEPEQESKDMRLVLCVDDDEGVIMLFRRYLTKQGYRVVGLTDGALAMEKARQIKPFAITLDVMMPDKDGWQVIQELKAHPDTRDIPVIMCSIVSEKEYGLSLGASDYLLKPILEEDLLAALERLDRGEGPCRVLVVDDQQEDRNLLRRMIESQDGYEVVEAAGGQEAIVLVQQVRPNIIILDLMMPDVDGFAVLESVKADRVTRSIPIIVVTAKDLTEEERDTLNRQVEKLLQKGLFGQQELLADVAAALGRIKTDGTTKSE